MYGCIHIIIVNPSKFTDIGKIISVYRKWSSIKESVMAYAGLLQVIKEYVWKVEYKVQTKKVFLNAEDEWN